MCSDVGAAKIYSAVAPTHKPLPFAMFAGNKLSPERDDGGSGKIQKDKNV